MRLIDADALIEQNKELADQEIEHPKYQMTLREVVDWMPTIEERKKGKWIELEPKGVWTSVYHCSECGGAVMSCKVDLPEYCGHCGARMEVEDDIS